MDDEEAYPTGSLKLYPCDICGRKFKQDSLMKHRNACKKLSKPKRKIFDSGRQRADGSDVNYVKTKETRKVQVDGEKIETAIRPNNWKEKHENFIRSVRQARNVSLAIKTGAPLPKFEPSAPPSDYVKCQYCGRSFSQAASERHIPFCETQSKRQKINNSAGNINSKAKVDTRTKYQPPLPAQNQARKQSSEAYSQPYQYQYQQGPAQVAYAQASNGYGGGGGGGGGSGGGGGGGYSRGATTGSINKQYQALERKPIRYDNTYYEPEVHEGAYSQKNKAILMNKAKSQSQLQSEQMLRTGRTNANQELNALARNRTGYGYSQQKESPINSRDPSANRRQVVVQQNGTRGAGSGSGGAAASNNNGAANSAKFCHECGSEFPVQWARFCSFCGDRRL